MCAQPIEAVPTRQMWLTTREAAAYLRTTVKMILHLVHAGRLRAHRLSGKDRNTFRFRREDLDAAMTL